MRTRRVLPAVAAILAMAGCVTPPPPPPPSKPVAPVARRAPPLDWFQQQVAAARQARATHMPKADTAGAQADYDGAMRAACTRVALSGPEKYQARCAALLRQSQPAAAEPWPCDDASTDPATLHACND